MRFQLEIQEGSDGVVVHALYAPNSRAAFLRLLPAAVPLLVGLVGRWEFSPFLYFIAAILFWYGVRPAYYCWAGVDVRLQTSDDRLLCRQPHADSPEISYSLALIETRFRRRFGRHSGISGLYAFEHGSNPFRARALLIPYLDAAQSLQVGRALQQYWARRKSRLPA